MIKDQEHLGKAVEEAPGGCSGETKYGPLCSTLIWGRSIAQLVEFKTIKSIY